jgi:hypothetical protein
VLPNLLRHLRHTLEPFSQKDPEFVAAAEKTRMTLNPIPGGTLHNMIVEGLSLPATLKE